MFRVLLTLLALSLPASASPPLPFNLGGSFELVDHNGLDRSEINPLGHPQLLFFGYANCLQICSVALPLMGEITDELADQGLAVTPVMITVDPERDNVASIGAPLKKLHPDFTGLTGETKDLQTAYDAFSVEHKLVYNDPLEGPVYAHGSFIYLLDKDGKFLTLMPPILSAARASEIVMNHVKGQAEEKVN